MDPQTIVRVAGPAVRVLGKLPAPLQLLIGGGRPIRIDGQLLEPEVQMVLKLFALMGDDTDVDRSVDQARANTRFRAAIFSSAAPIELAEVRDLSLPGAQGRIGARLYVPHGARTPSPLLVYFHGGGFVVGDLDTHDASCRFLARESRLRVLSIDYRSAPENPFPAAVEDCVAAFRHLAAEPDTYGAIPDAIGVGGDSAGAGLAAVTALIAREDDLPPAFQLLIYPVADLSRHSESYETFAEGFFLTAAQMDWYHDKYLSRPGEADDWRASPLLADDVSGVAPAHVVVAGFDPLRDEGLAYAAKLERAGVPVTMRNYTGLVHGFVNAVGMSRACAQAMTEIAAQTSAALTATRTSSIA